jgi:hypothetical protein
MARCQSSTALMGGRVGTAGSDVQIAFNRAMRWRYVISGVRCCR